MAGNYRSAVFGNMGTTIMVLVLLIALIPIPAVLLDILITVNIILTLLPLYDAFSRKKPESNFSYSINHSSFSTTIMTIILINLAACIAAAKQILLRGPEFESMFIKSFADVIAFYGSVSLSVFFIIFASLNAYLYIKYTRNTYIEIENAAQTLLETRHKKMLAVETDYNKRIITEQEAEEIKNKIRHEIDYHNSLYDACNYLLNNEKVKLVIFVLIISAGTFIGRRLRGEETDESFITYVSLAVSSGFYLMIPPFLLTLSLRRAGLPAISKVQ